MSNIQYANLPVAINLNGSEIVAITQAGTTCRTTTGAIAALLTSRAYTVAGLPTPSSQIRGLRVNVTDSTASPVFTDVATGGGSLFAPVYCDGTDWRNG